MNEAGNGQYRLRSIEERLTHLEEKGSRHVEVLRERVKNLEDRQTYHTKELREDIDGIRNALGKVAYLLLTIPVTIIGGILLFWIQAQ